MKQPRITRHAVLRFCERVRADLDPHTDDGYVQAFMALDAMMRVGTLKQGRPPWHRQSEGTGRYIDVGGHIAIMLSTDRQGPGYVVRTILVCPREWYEGRVSGMEAESAAG